MNSAYAVGATFTLENLFSPTVKKISDELTVFDGKVEATKNNLQNVIPAKALAARIEEVCGSFNLLGPAADKAATAMLGAMGRAEAGVAQIATSINGELDAAFGDADIMAGKAATGMIGAMTRAEAGVARAATGINGEIDAAFVDADAVANKAANGMIAAMKRAALGVSAETDAIKLGFSGAFAGMDAGLLTAADGITTQFARITKAAGESTLAIGNMRRELVALSEIHMPPVPQLPAGAGGFGRGSHGGHRGGLGRSDGGFHLDNRESVRTPLGHVSGRGGAGAGIAGMALVGDAIYEAAELSDIVTKVIITSQMDPGQNPMTYNRDAKLVGDMIKHGSNLSGASIKDVGKMFLSTEREFQGFDFQKKISTMDLLLPAIAAEAKNRDETMEEAGKSLIGVLHQAGLVEPADLVKGAKEFQFTTMATPVGLEQFKGALSYSMPLHNQIGMDTGTIMLMTSLMQSSGITNTKSGTWLDAMFTKAQPETDVLGPLKKEQIQHNNALKMLGLIGDDGKQNWHVMGADGKEDWNASVIKFGQLLHDNQEKIPDDERSDVLRRAFGVQGGRAASLFSQGNINEQLKILKEKEEAFKGGDATLSAYSNASTIQQFRVATQEFQTSMATLGTQLLPTVNFGLKGFSSALEALPGDWEKTKKMWSDRVDGVLGLPHKAAEQLGKLPGPLGAPFRDESKPAFDPNKTYETGGFVPMSYHGEGAKQGGWLQDIAYHGEDIEEGDRFRDIAYRTDVDNREDRLQTEAYRSDEGAQKGGMSAAEEVIYRGTLRAFIDFANGKASWGGLGAGGIQNASFDGGDFGFGGGTTRGGGAANLRYGSHGRTPGGSAGSIDGNLIGGEYSDRGSFNTKAPGIMRHLMSDFGIDAEGAAKIMGNIGHESGGLQAFGEKGGGGGIGWSQWTGPRNREFRAWAAEHGLDPHSDAANYGMLKHDLEGRYSGVIAAIKRGASLEEVERMYEGAGVKNYRSRHAYEAAALDAFRGHPGGADTASLPPGSSGNDPLGIAGKLDGMSAGQASKALGHVMHAGQWCADFVNGVIEKGGGKGTGSSMASSFHMWGQHVDFNDVKRGDVIVEDHGRGRGHVGLATGAVERDKAGNIVAIGMTSGNHGDQVVADYMERVGEISELRRGAAAVRPQAPGVTAGVRSAPKQPDVHHIEVRSVIDGKQVGKTVARIMGKSMRFPSSMGAPDPHSHYVSPGTPVMDSA